LSGKIATALQHRQQLVLLAVSALLADFSLLICSLLLCLFYCSACCRISVRAAAAAATQGGAWPSCLATAAAGAAASDTATQSDRACSSSCQRPTGVQGLQHTLFFVGYHPPPAPLCCTLHSDSSVVLGLDTSVGYTHPLLLALRLKVSL
jgi:hypothetical protein